MFPHGVILKIRDSGARIYIACSGAGAGLQSLLWSVPGASSFLVGASFPYATEATDEFLGFKPEKYCSPETAIDLASEAFMRAGGGKNAIGIGLTASVASTTAHRGAHRVHAAWVRHGAPLAVVPTPGAASHDVELEKGSGFDARTLDGMASDAIGVNAILDALGLPMLPPPQRWLNYSVNDRDTMARRRFFERPLFRANGTRAVAPGTLLDAFPGSFNPPHAGHLGMAESYRRATGRAPTFWITADPPHKAPAEVADLLQRARALRGQDVLFTPGAPLFLDKSRMYPGCDFIIGADGLKRLLDPKWGPEVRPMLDEFRRLATRFYVFARADAGELVTLRDIEGAPLDLCEELPGRWDVSSTELRRAG